MQKITFFRCSIRFRLCASPCCFCASFLLFFFLLWNPPTKSLPMPKTPNQTKTSNTNSPTSNKKKIKKKANFGFALNIVPKIFLVEIDCDSFVLESPLLYVPASGACDFNFFFHCSFRARCRGWFTWVCCYAKLQGLW